ncbi:Large ribosomal subunit protein bL21m [Madurella fahalii]|uniref:Large ribosomal subunit protein bL21m n=1 Tax=Madurella fahalii TaxID=1157608 RepID=A0ABQ0G0P6_9PEZI
MSRALLRSVLELRTPVTRFLPIRTTTATPAVATARFLHQTAQIIEPAHPEPSVIQHAQPPQQTFPSSQATQPPPPPTQPSSSSSSSPSSASASSAPRGPISESVRALLPLLAAQPGHYITVHIHGRAYLVTEGDSVRLPFKMPGVAPGDVLRLTRASALGSRDFTLRGAPYVDERLFACRAVVTGTESEPMRVKIKKKRRCRRTKHVRSKHRYTMLRISELKVCSDVAELES